jgi:hypothetical protein
MPRPYLPALQITLRQTAAAYGYTLSVATTVAALTSVHGSPDAGDLFLFVAGGLGAFAGLDGVVEIVGSRDHGTSPEVVFPFAGALNFAAVSAALGAALGVAHLLKSELAWFTAPLATTAVYLVVVALQVTVVAALRSSSH